MGERTVLTTGRLDGLVITPLMADGRVTHLIFTVDSLPGLRVVVEREAVDELRAALTMIPGLEPL